MRVNSNIISMGSNEIRRIKLAAGEISWRLGLWEAVSGNEVWQISVVLNGGEVVLRARNDRHPYFNVKKIESLGSFVFSKTLERMWQHKRHLLKSDIRSFAKYCRQFWLDRLCYEILKHYDGKLFVRQRGIPIG